MANVPWESEEKRNYICMRNIVIDIVSEGLRRVFKTEWNTRYQASLGAWDDTSVSGLQLFHREYTRSRPNKNMYQAKFRHGDTNQWDCSVLFDAILYSNSIGKSSLKLAIKTEVDNIRNMRNKIMHADETTLSEADFQSMISDVDKAFKALNLPVNDITQMKIKRNLYKSFKVLPPKPTHEVVYRSEKVKEIQQELQTLRIDSDSKLTYFYISGNPGSGKSELCRQLGENLFQDVNFETQTTFVMTLNAKDLDTLLHSYEDFCRRLNCSESVLRNVINSSKTSKEKIEDLRSLIESRIKSWKRWWIIVDNVENLDDISPLLPQMGDEVWSNGQIILTIQNTNAVPSDSLFTRHISLSRGMKNQECRQLLSILSGTDANEPLFDQVAEKLDHQPLAMAAAAVYFKKVIQSKCCPTFSWQDYLEKLKSKRKATEEQLRKTSSAYPSTLSAAVSLAVEKSAKNNFILNHTFNLFSLISFEPLPVDIVVKFIQQLDQNCDKEEIYLALKDCSLFLLTETEDCDISLHPVVHEATKSLSDCKEPETTCNSQSGIPNRRANVDAATTVQNLLKALDRFQHRDDKMKMIAHLKAFNAAIKKLFVEQDSLYSISLGFEKPEIYDIYNFFGITLNRYCEHQLAVKFLNTNLQIWRDSKNHNYRASTFSELGNSYTKMGEFDKAIDYYQGALQIYEKQLDPNHVAVAVSYNNIGLVYRNKGELDRAMDCYQRALKIREKQLGSNHVDVAVSYNNIGGVYSDKGDLDQAMDYYQRALDIKEKQLGPNHVDVAFSYNNIGVVYSKKGELDLAKDYYQQALDIKEKQLGPNHVAVALSYNNIGLVYSKKGDLDRAMDCYQRALEIQEKLLGPKHVDVAVSYNNIGGVYSDKGDLDQAMDYYQRALDIKEKQLGPNHVAVALSYNNIGLVYSKKGDLDRAMDCYQRALEILEKQLGPNHVDVAVSYNNIGRVYYDKGDLDQAMDYYQRTLKIQEKQLGLNHVDVAVSYGNIGRVYYDKGDLDQAKDYYQRALEILEKQLGPNHVDVAVSYNNIGQVYYDKGDLDQAMNYYQRTLEILEKQLDPNHVDVAVSYNNIGRVYYDKGDLDHAKDYYQRALEIQEKQLGPNHVDVAVSYNNIGRVYYDKGGLDQAKDCYQRALEIQEKQLGPNHVDVADSYNNIGVVYSDKGDLDQAMDYYQRALEIQEKQLGPNHVDVADSYNNIGGVYSDKGDLDHAKDYYQRTLEIQEKELGPNHVDVADSYNNIGRVYYGKGGLDQAKDYYQRALEIQEKQLGPNHVDVADSYNNIGRVYYDKGGLDHAKDYYQRALEIQEKQLGPNHVDVAVSYNNIGQVYYDKGDLDQAKDYYQRAQEISIMSAAATLAESGNIYFEKNNQYIYMCVCVCVCVRVCVCVCVNGF
jgi:tetratricopeptide (TPR) repeat protein